MGEEPKISGGGKKIQGEGGTSWADWWPSEDVVYAFQGSKGKSWLKKGSGGSTAAGNIERKLHFTGEDYVRALLLDRGPGQVDKSRPPHRSPSKNGCALSGAKPPISSEPSRLVGSSRRSFWTRSCDMRRKPSRQYHTEEVRVSASFWFDFKVALALRCGALRCVVCFGVFAASPCRPMPLQGRVHHGAWNLHQWQQWQPGLYIGVRLVIESSPTTRTRGGKKRGGGEEGAEIVPVPSAGTCWGPRIRPL